MSFIFHLAIALALTIITEFVVYLAIVRKEPITLFMYSILINSFTNPLLNYLYNFEFDELYVLEIIVALVESIIIQLLMKVHYSRALFISLAANLASLLVGLAIFG